MNSPESITSQLWSEREAFTNLQEEEFSSESALLVAVKYELRAMKSFHDVDGARAFFNALNGSE